MAGDSEMHNLSRLMGNDHEDVERTEEQIMDDGEITSPHLMSMILEKGCPSLPRPPFPHLIDVLLDRRLPQFDAQLEEFSLDVFRTPGSILQGHLLDEVNG